MEASQSATIYIRDEVRQHNSFFYYIKCTLEYMFRPSKWSSSGLCVRPDDDHLDGRNM